MVLSPSIIRAFRPFNLQHKDCTDEICQDVQEFVYYCESRFRAIILAILLASPEKIKWMQLRLRDELFVISGLIGLMTAVGRVIDIPLVIRSLADGIAMLDDMYFPVVFDTDLIQMIEAGTGQGHGKVVEKYHLQWWTKDLEPDSTGLMSHENISMCLEYYERQLKKAGYEITPVSVISNPQPSSLETSHAAGSAADSDFVATHSTQQMKDLFTSLNGYQRATEGKVQLSARRVASLYLLFKEITLKETADTPTAGPIAPGKKSEAAQFLRHKSLHLFKTQQNTKEEVSQWTSGIRLTKNDVLGLVHEPLQEEHSGYHSTQYFGSLSGLDSPCAVPGDVASQGVYSECGEACAAAGGVDNPVYPRPPGFYPQRPSRKIPSDDNAREAYLKSHPEIREEMDRAWNSNSAQWDQDGFYYGDLTNQSDNIGAGIGADVGAGGQPDEDMDLDNTMHASTVSRGILDLYQDTDTSQESENGSDVEMASPLPQEHRNKSVADLFQEDDDNSDENSCNNTTTSFADLYDSDSDESGPQTNNRISIADLYPADTNNSEAESDQPGNSERASMADLYDSDMDDSKSGSHPPSMSRNVQQSAASHAAPVASASASGRKVFTMADFDYVEEDEFADVLSGPSIRESDSD